MSLRICCPACKTVLTVNDDARGRNVRCTKCSTVLAVPAAVSSGGGPKPAVPTPSPTVASPPPQIAAPSVAVATPIQKPASGIQEPPKVVALATPIQKPASAIQESPKVVALATPIQKPASGIQEPPKVLAVATPIQKPGSDSASANPQHEAGDAASGVIKTKPKKSGFPIVILLVAGGGALFLFLSIFVVCGGAFFLFRSDSKPAEQQAKVKATAEKKKAADPIVETKPDPVPVPEPIVDPNAGKPLPAQIPEEIVKRVKGATAYLRVTRQGGGVSQGSGFFAIQPGIVITNAHVLGMLQAGSQPPIDVQVTVNSGESNEVKLEGTVLGVDRQSDLGIIRIGESPYLPKPLFLETDRKLIELQPVYIFGFPFGEQLGANITVTPSAVSSLRKNPTGGGLKEIQVNGGMHPGNSGGPVVNSYGNVVGVAVSVLQGTTINFAVPAENVRLIMDGRLADTIIGEPFLQDGQSRLPVRFTCLDPLKRVRELRVDVWTGAPGEPRVSMNQAQTAVPGDGQRQSHQITYRDGGGALDVPLPPLPPGKVYWLQPSVSTGRGVQWEASVPLAGPFNPLERKSANVLVSLTAQKERTVKLKSLQTITRTSGKRKDDSVYKIDADILEVLSPDPKGALLRTAFGPTAVSVEAGGKVRNDAQVNNVLRQMAPAFIIDSTNMLQRRSDRNLPNLQPFLRQEVIESYAQFCNSIEAVTVPMPNRALQPLETWQTKVPMILRGAGRVENADLALTCTFEGTRLRDKRSEGFISLTGIVQGRGLNSNKVGGHVTGKVAFDLTGGYIAQAIFKITSGYDVQGLQITDALDIHLDRSPGNPLNISPPTNFKPGPGLNQNLVLDGKILLKIDGTLTANDPPYVNPNFQNKNARMKVHNVKLEAGKLYAISLNSNAFDSYLVLTSPQGQVVAEDDDGGGFPNALIVYAPTQSGEYRITATAFDGQLGAYQLSVLELAAKK